MACFSQSSNQKSRGVTNDLRYATCVRSTTLTGAASEDFESGRVDSHKEWNACLLSERGHASDHRGGLED